MRASPDISKGERPDRTALSAQLPQSGALPFVNSVIATVGQIFGVVARRWFIILFLAPSIVATVIGCTAWYLGWPAHTPIGLRLVVSAVCFAVSPGAIVLILLDRKQREEADPIDSFLYVVIASFSINLAINLAVFATNACLERVITLSLPAQVALLLGATAKEWGRLRAYFPHFHGWSRTGTVVVALVAGGLGALCYATYLNGYPLVNPEEIAVIEKIAYNP